jgi:hypothetical protein
MQGYGDSWCIQGVASRNGYEKLKRKNERLKQLLIAAARTLTDFQRKEF